MLLTFALEAAASDEVTGGVAGVVSVVGNVPAPYVTEQGGDVQVCGPPRHVAETLIVGDRGALGNAFAWIDGVPNAAPLTSDPAGYAIDQKGCVYVPHAMLVPQGAAVVFTNDDPVLHNIHLRHDTANKHFNKVGRTGQDLTFTPTAPGVLHVVCNLHRWMDAIIVVAGHEYYARTGLDGRFAFEDVPVGTYTLHVYHEALGEQTRSITVLADRTLEVPLTFPAPATAPPPYGLER